ncbi:hypothetical protein VPH35_032761 [Triticum aestivum]
MSTGVRRRGGAFGNRNEEYELLRDELGAFSEEELERRPEVRIINKYAVTMAYIRIGVKGVGALALLWATVVLLGGFVSDLTKIDFWFMTSIAFVQATGIFDTIGGASFAFFEDWLVSLGRNVASDWGQKHDLERTHLYMGQWIKIKMHMVLRVFLIVTFLPVVLFALGGPVLCVVLSVIRLVMQDYGITAGDASKANMKRGMNLYYSVSLAHGAVCLCVLSEMFVDEGFIVTVSQQHGFSPEVLGAYLLKTKQMCLNNPASMVSWNLITYGVDLLDSHLPEDYATGGRVLTMLIDQDTPVPITCLLIRSPRQRIQKLIGTLAWRNPVDREMRWLAARIVEHLAGDLSLAQFPGALECISSLFETSYHKNVDQEALHLPFVIGRNNPRIRISLLQKIVIYSLKALMKIAWHSNIYTGLIYWYWYILLRDSAPMNGGTLELDSKQRGSGEDLVLPGLRILENLAQDRHNCTMIYNTKDLLWKIVAPVRSNKFVEDIKSSAAWTKVVDGSLKVVSRLMSSSGSTSVEMRRLIRYDTNVVKNLKAVLNMDMKSSVGIIQLKMRAIEVLIQLALHHPASTSATVIREHLVVRALHYFLQDWMGDYLKDEKMRIEHQSTNQQNPLPVPSTGSRMDNHVLTGNAVSRLILFIGAAQAHATRAREAREFRAAEAHEMRAAEARLSVMRAAQERLMKEAQESASRLKEKAGEALAMLSSDSEAVKSFTVEVCTEDNVHGLTDLLDSSIKTIKCEIGETEPVEIEINICCRISATVILKHLRNRDMKLTLEKVLAELLPIQAEASSTSQWWGRLISCSCIAAFGNDIENRCFPAFRNNTANPSDGGHDEPSTSPIHHIQQCGERRLQAELISLVAVNLENNNFDFAAILNLPPRASPVSLLEEFVVKLKKMVEDNMYATPACLVIQKLACKMVTGFLQHDRNVEVIGNQNIVGTLLDASKVMAVLESNMLFTGVHHDCHGVPLKPFLSDLANQAKDLLKLKKQAEILARAQLRRTNSAPAGASPT